MAVFYVDFENVHDAGLEGLNDLTANDRVILFYNKEQKISIDGMLEINNCKAVIEYRKTLISGRNYLDFQLGTYLGYGMNEYRNEKVVVVSKDSGFDSIVHFWKQEGVDIIRNKSLKLVPSVDAEAPSTDDAKVDITVVVETDEVIPTDNTTKLKKRRSRKNKSKSDSEVEANNNTQQPEKEEPAIATDDSLPERFRKKMRPVLNKLGLSSLQYAKVYKAVISQQKNKPYRQQLIKDYGEELGQSIFDHTQVIFAEYWKSKQL